MAGGFDDTPTRTVEVLVFVPQSFVVLSRGSREWIDHARHQLEATGHRRLQLWQTRYQTRYQRDLCLGSGHHDEHNLIGFELDTVFKRFGRPVFNSKNLTRLGAGATAPDLFFGLSEVAPRVVRRQRWLWTEIVPQ